MIFYPALGHGPIGHGPVGLTAGASVAGTAANLSATQTLEAVTQTALTDPIVAANASQTLQSVTQTATIKPLVSANASQTLQPVTQTTIAKPIVAANASQTLQPVTQTVTAATTRNLTANQTLEPISQTTAVTVGNSRNLTASQTLQPVTQTATGDVDHEITANQNLAPVTQTANAGITFTLTANQTIEPVTQTAEAAARVRLTANQTLQPVTQVAGDISRNLNAAQTLEPITQNATMTTGLIRPNFVPSIEVDQVIDALREFTLPFMQGGEVVRAQTNRVAQPRDPVAVLQEILQVDIRTPYTDYQPNTNTATIHGPQRIDIQMDFYGIKSGEICMSVKSALRTAWASDQFPINIKPLYASDGTQSPLTTGEQQYESRWTLTVSLQYNPIITVPQQFADVATVYTTAPVDVFERL